MKKTPRPTRRPARSSAPTAQRARAFNAFIAYADVPAAREAMATIAEVLRESGHAYELHPMLWRLDQLTAPKWHDVALADAASAHVVVLASSSRGALPVSHETWVAEFLARKQGTRTTLVTLLGPDDAWTISIDVPRAKAQPQFHTLVGETRKAADFPTAALTSQAA